MYVMRNLVIFETVDKNKHMSSNQTVPEYSLPSSKEELEGVKVLKDDVLGTFSLKEIVQILERWISETGMDRMLISGYVYSSDCCLISTGKGFPNMYVKMNRLLDVARLSHTVNCIFKRSYEIYDRNHVPVSSYDLRNGSYVSSSSYEPYSLRSVDSHNANIDGAMNSFSWSTCHQRLTQLSESCVDNIQT